jgi:F0F1-type ATP synthase membrane subunit b/b'
LKELINRILADEESGRSRVAEAQEKAKKIRQDAETESIRIGDDGLKKAREKADNLIAQVQAEMKMKKETEFAESEKAGKTWFNQKKKEFDRIADGLFDMLIRRTDAK